VVLIGEIVGGVVTLPDVDKGVDHVDTRGPGPGLQKLKRQGVLSNTEDNTDTVGMVLKKVLFQAEPAWLLAHRLVVHIAFFLLEFLGLDLLLLD